MGEIMQHQYSQSHPKQCGSRVVLTINAPVHSVWSVVRRFDRPQAYRMLIKACAMVLGSGKVGSTREVVFRSGLAWSVSVDRLERVDEDRHVMVYRVIGGDHKLTNFRLTTTLDEGGGGGSGRRRTVVTEEYTVDVPEDSNEEDTCFLLDTVLRFNLSNLAYVAENMI